MDLPLLKLTLPLPISVNTAYAGTVKRHKSNAYMNWELRAKISFFQQNNGYTIEGDEWLNVEYKFYMPLYNKNGTKKKIDTFNYEKVLSDFLGHKDKRTGIQTILPGFSDEKIRKGIVEKIDSDRNEVEITIIEEISHNKI